MQEHGSTPTSIRSTVHLLADQGSMPEIAAHVERIMGRAVVFVTMSSEHRTSSYTTGTAVSFSGEPAAVEDLLKRCLFALEDLAHDDGEPQ
jgi:hypothetical protein